VPESTKDGTFRWQNYSSSASLFLVVAAAQEADGTNHYRNREQQANETQCASAVAKAAVESEAGMAVAQDD
jgi:hypothetical protein